MRLTRPLTNAIQIITPWGKINFKIKISRMMWKISIDKNRFPILWSIFHLQNDSEWNIVIIGSNGKHSFVKLINRYNSISWLTDLKIEAWIETSIMLRLNSCCSQFLVSFSNKNMRNKIGYLRWTKFKTPLFFYGNFRFLWNSTPTIS